MNEKALCEPILYFLPAPFRAVSNYHPAVPPHPSTPGSRIHSRPTPSQGTYYPQGIYTQSTVDSSIHPRNYPNASKAGSSTTCDDPSGIICNPVRLSSTAHDPRYRALHVRPLRLSGECHVSDVVNIESAVTASQCGPSAVLPFPTQLVQCSTRAHTRGHNGYLRAAHELR